MKHPLLGTHVLIRYFVENPKTTRNYKGVFPFFSKLETGELLASLPDLVLFEAYKGDCDE